MSLDERLLKRLQMGLALRRSEQGKALKPLPPRDPWPQLVRVWSGPVVPFIETAYRSILGRDADEGGIRSFQAALAEGMPRAELVRRLLDSSEAKRHPIVGGWQDEMYRVDAAEPFTCPTYLLHIPDPAAFVHQSYLRLLGRAPGAAETTRWLRRFRLPILGRRIYLLRSLERNQERATLIHRIERERLDEQFKELHVTVRVSEEKIERRLHEESVDSRDELERHTSPLRYVGPREEELQKRLEAIHKSIQSLEMLARGIRADRDSRVSAVLTTEETGPAPTLHMIPRTMCGLCGGALLKSAHRHRGRYLQCVDCDLHQVFDPDWTGTGSGASAEAGSRPGPFADSFTAFGLLLALRAAGLWHNSAARYFDYNGEGVLTRMLRDHGLDAWLYHPPESVPLLASEYGLSRLEEFDPESIDVVTAFGMLDHLADPTAFGRELRPLLTPVGTALFSIGGLLPDPEAETPTSLRQAVAIWSRQSLAHFADQLGFGSVGYLSCDAVGCVVIFSPMTRVELDSRLEGARAILNSDDFLAEAIRPWNLVGTAARGPAAETARPVRGQGGLRCAS